MGVTKGVSKRVLLDTLILAFPSFPFLVVIISTPLAAALPYSAAALAPFKTVMFSISSGLIFDKISPPSVVLPPDNRASVICVEAGLAIGTPSITINGEFSPKTAAFPRSSNLEEPPAPVELGVMTNPAVLPCNALIKLASLALVNSSPPTF